MAKYQYVIRPSNIIQLTGIRDDKVHYCTQCKKDMGNEWLLGPVCRKCFKANHKRVTGRK